MNEFSNETRGRYGRGGIRHARHLRHMHRLHRCLRRAHRLSHGFDDGQDLTCHGHRGRAFGHHRGLEGTGRPGRPGGFARRGHHDHAGRGRNRRAVYELHKALADVARTGDEQLRGDAAQIITEATSRLNGLLAADR
jgi:hypothetical protein